MNRETKLVKSLTFIAKILEENQIEYRVYGSVLLLLKPETSQHKISDIDIAVNYQDIPIIKLLLLNIGFSMKEFNGFRFVKYIRFTHQEYTDIQFTTSTTLTPDLIIHHVIGPLKLVVYKYGYLFVHELNKLKFKGVPLENIFTTAAYWNYLGYKKYKDIELYIPTNLKNIHTANPLCVLVVGNLYLPKFLYFFVDKLRYLTTKYFYS